MLVNIKRVSSGKRKKCFICGKEQNSLNIARMLNILHVLVCPYARIKCNIVIYKSNVYKTSTN